MADEINRGEALEYDMMLEGDGDQYELLPKGVYNYVIASKEEGWYNGSANMQPCHKLNLTLRLSDPATGEEKGIVYDTLYMNTKTKFRIEQISVSCGLKQKGVPAKFNPNDLEGRGGKLDLDINNYTDRDGNERQNNKVKKYIPKEQKAFTPGQF